MLREYWIVWLSAMNPPKENRYVKIIDSTDVGGFFMYRGKIRSEWACGAVYELNDVFPDAQVVAVVPKDKEHPTIDSVKELG